MGTAILEAPQVLEAATSPRKLTAEEFWAECRLERAELVDGEILEKMPVGEAHAYVASNIVAALMAWVRAMKAGRVYIELGFVLGSGTVRAPDVAFVSAERLRSERPAPGLFDGAPTVAIEIVSPGDGASEVEAKVREYLAAGTSAVWVVYPEVRAVTVRTADAGRGYGGSEMLSGEPALPGFTVSLIEIFD